MSGTGVVRRLGDEVSARGPDAGRRLLTLYAVEWIRGTCRSSRGAFPSVTRGAGHSVQVACCGGPVGWVEDLARALAGTRAAGEIVHLPGRGTAGASDTRPCGTGDDATALDRGRDAVREPADGPDPDTAPALILVDAGPDEADAATLAGWAAGGADLAIRFPVERVRYLAGFGGVPLADMPPYARRKIESLTRLLGGGRDWLFRWAERLRSLGAAAAEEAMVRELARRLAGEGFLTAVRPVRPAGAEGPEYLLLAGGDPGRLLRMNEVLTRETEAGRVEWVGSGQGIAYRRPVDLDLFRGSVRAAPRRAVDPARVAALLLELGAGRCLRRDELLASLVESDLRPIDVRRSLRLLAAEGRVSYAGLSSPDAVVDFGPAERRPRPGGRARSGRRRGGVPDLFDDPTI